MKIVVGGVPEHFNFPWHFAIDKGAFSERGVEISWVDFPGGTGAMTSSLRKNELNMAVLLMEGAVKEICHGADFKIIKTFVESPLIWGIHTASSNQKANLSHLDQMKYAVSRIGSGSHLMSFIHAQQTNQAITDSQMVIVNDLSGALKSLKNLETDLFLWEKYMTKPFVDAGELRRISEFPTPWPCFVIVAKQELLSEGLEVLEVVLSILNETVSLLLTDIENTKKMISEKYRLLEEDVADWLQRTKWSVEPFVSQEALGKSLYFLSSLGFVPAGINASELVYDVKILA